MEAKDLGEISGVYLTGGGVAFTAEGVVPKWPENCVVCGKYCAETAKFYSRRTVRFANFQWTVKSRSFLVPVHKTQGTCLDRLRSPVPAWIWLMAASVALGAGGFMSYIAHPIPSDRLGAFIVFGAVGFCVTLLPIIYSFPPSLEINDGSEGCYYANFKDKDYARRFAALNPELVRK